MSSCSTHTLPPPQSWVTSIPSIPSTPSTTSFVTTHAGVSNGRDAFATTLPHSGDHIAFPLSPHNLFSFSHLWISRSVWNPRRVFCAVMRLPTRRPCIVSCAVMPTHPPHSTGEEVVRALHDWEVSRFWGECSRMRMRFISTWCKRSRPETGSGRIR